MRSGYEELMERARRRKVEDTVAAAAISKCIALPPGRRRRFLRAHATAGMALAVARHALAIADLSLLKDAEEIAATLRDPYDGPYARFVVWSARGAVLRAFGRPEEALAALDRAACELEEAPEAFSAPFRADLALDRAALLMEMGDAVAARTSAWQAAGWVHATSDRAGLARLTKIV
ncbi:MAG: hypothetical protein ACXW31_01815 [Thermoanaerobaculia bacterium]